MVYNKHVSNIKGAERMRKRRENESSEKRAEIMIGRRKEERRTKIELIPMLAMIAQGFAGPR